MTEMIGVGLRGKGTIQFGGTFQIQPLEGRSKKVSYTISEDCTAEGNFDQKKLCALRPGRPSKSITRARKDTKPEELARRKCTHPGCDREFKRRCDLTKHEKTHSRPWKCPFSTCKYHDHGWPTKKELDRHFYDRHYTALPVYECQYKPCPYKSKRESNCKQHMEKAHGWKYVRTKTGKTNIRVDDPGFSPYDPDRSMAEPLARLRTRNNPTFGGRETPSQGTASRRQGIFNPLPPRSDGSDERDSSANHMPYQPSTLDWIPRQNGYPGSSLGSAGPASPFTSTVSNPQVAASTPIRKTLLVRKNYEHNVIDSYEQEKIVFESFTLQQRLRTDKSGLVPPRVFGASMVDVRREPASRRKEVPNMTPMEVLGAKQRVDDDSLENSATPLALDPRNPSSRHFGPGSVPRQRHEGIASARPGNLGHLLNSTPGGQKLKRRMLGNDSMAHGLRPRGGLRAADSLPPDMIEADPPHSKK